MRKRDTAIFRSRPHPGYTLVEVLIASAISMVVAIALASLTMMISRLGKSIFSQQLYLKEAQAAIEGINLEIRPATTPLRVLDANGNPAVQGNSVQFSRLGEASGHRSISLVSVDNDLMTPRDNTLVYDPNTTQAGDEIVFSRWVTPLDPAGVFSYNGATTALRVWMRVGDPMGVSAQAMAAANAVSGPGIQGAEINISVAPRN